MAFKPRGVSTSLQNAPAEYSQNEEQQNRRRIEQANISDNARLLAIEAVVSEQQAAIADPAGGGTIDAQARTAISSILTALRNHGLIAP